MMAEILEMSAEEVANSALIRLWIDGHVVLDEDVDDRLIPWRSRAANQVWAKFLHGASRPILGVIRDDVNVAGHTTLDEAIVG